MTSQVSINNKQHVWILEGVKSKIQISQQLSTRIDSSSYLGPAVREALRLQSDALDPSRKVKAIRFHLVHRQNHLLLELVLKVNRSSRPKNTIKIEDVNIRNFEQAKAVFPRLHSDEQFLHGLHRFPTIEIDQNERVKGVPAVANAEQHYSAPLPKAIGIGNNSIILSHECLDGLKGKRGEDHVVDISIIEQCLSKKIKKLKASENNKRLAFYFRVQLDDEPQFLNLVCVRKNVDTFVVITAYYLDRSIIGNREGVKGEQLQVFIDNLPKVKGL